MEQQVLLLLIFEMILIFSIMDLQLEKKLLKKCMMK